jgi:hypothetical protein
MFAIPKRSWVWLGALTLALMTGAITVGIAAGKRPLPPRAGPLRIRRRTATGARRSFRMPQGIPAKGYPVSNISPGRGGDAEGVDEAALQQA